MAAALLRPSCRAGGGDRGTVSARVRIKKVRDSVTITVRRLIAVTKFLPVPETIVVTVLISKIWYPVTVTVYRLTLKVLIARLDHIGDSIAIAVSISRVDDPVIIAVDRFSSCVELMRVEDPIIITVDAPQIGPEVLLLNIEESIIVIIIIADISLFISVAVELLCVR